VATDCAEDVLILMPALASPKGDCSYHLSVLVRCGRL
jgi:hypothetical protein